MVFNPAGLGLATNIALFAVAAVAVWRAGTRISGHADVISRKTGIGNAVVGMLLLGGVTSLPELAVTVTAALGDNVALAVNNIFGGVAMQVAILVLADFLIGRRALTSVIPDPMTMLQGTLTILMLAIAAAGMVAGDRPFWGIGLWSWGILATYLCAIWILSRDRGPRTWLAARHGHVSEQLLGEKDEEENRTGGGEAGMTLRGAVARAAIAGLVILVAGYVLSSTGEAIARQTGLGQSFGGYVLVAVSTSLPEVSTVFAATRLGLYTMAISDIFGTNLFDTVLLFVVDAVATGKAALDRVGDFALFGAILGIIVTALYVAGLAERRDLSFARLGVDSIVVLVAYAGGLVLLYAMR